MGSINRTRVVLGGLLAGLVNLVVATLAGASIYREP